MKHTKLIIISMSIYFGSTAMLFAPPPEAPKPESQALQKVQEKVQDKQKKLMQVAPKFEENVERLNEWQRRLKLWVEDDLAKLGLREKPFDNLDATIRNVESQIQKAEGFEKTNRERILSDLIELKATMDVLDKIPQLRAELEKIYVPVMKREPLKRKEMVELPMSIYEAAQIVKNFLKFKADIESITESLVQGRRSFESITIDEVLGRLLANKMNELEDMDPENKEKINELQNTITDLRNVRILAEQKASAFDTYKNQINDIFGSAIHEVIEPPKPIAVEPARVKAVTETFIEPEKEQPVVRIILAYPKEPHASLQAPVLRPGEKPDQYGAVVVKAYDPKVETYETLDRGLLDFIEYLQKEKQQKRPTVLDDEEQSTWINENIEQVIKESLLRPELDMDKLISEISNKMKELEDQWKNLREQEKYEQYNTLQTKWQQWAAIKDLLEQRRKLIEWADWKVDERLKQYTRLYQAWEEAENKFLEQLKKPEGLAIESTEIGELRTKLQQTTKKEHKDFLEALIVLRRKADSAQRGLLIEALKKENNQDLSEVYAEDNPAEPIRDKISAALETAYDVLAKAEDPSAIAVIKKEIDKLVILRDMLDRKLNIKF